MKRTILFLLLPALLLASCSSDDDELAPDTQAGGQIRFEIGFAGQGEPQGRTVTGENFTTTWKNGDAIGLYIVKGSGGLQASGNWVNNFRITYDDSTWSDALPLDKKYYPNDGKELHFYAYYPYDENMTDPTAYAFSVNIDQRAEAYNASDLLLAKAENVVKSGNTVSLQFEHAMALVQVEVLREVNVPVFDDAKFTVKLTGAKTNATLNWGTTPLTGIGTAVDIVMHKVADMNYTYRALVPAQTLTADSKVTFVQTTDGKAIDMEYQDISSDDLTTAGAAHRYSVTLGWGIDPNHKYKKGDVYPHVGPAMGIVFYTDDDGIHGKVVGLEEEEEEVTWADASATGATNATSLDNGRVNMRAICNKSKIFSGYPAFEWIHAMNPTNTDYNVNATNIWYLPAKDELVSLREAYAADSNFNDKLTTAGGTGLTANWYWSSSEDDTTTTHAWHVNFSSEDLGIYPKDNGNHARCILAF